MPFRNYDRVCLQFQKVRVTEERWGLKYRCISIWMAVLGWTLCLCMVLLPMPFIFHDTPPNVESWSLASFSSRMIPLKAGDIGTSSTTLLSNEMESYYLKADSLFQLENFEEAAEMYEKWITLRSRREDKKLEEQQPLHDLLDKDQNVTRSMYRLLKSYLSTGRLADAQRWADFLQRADMLHAEPAYYLCKALRDQGDFPSAYYYYLLATNLSSQDTSDENMNALFPAQEGMHAYLLNYEKLMLWQHVGGLTDRYSWLHGLALSRQLLENPGLPSALRQSIYNDLQHSAFSLGGKVQVLCAEKSTEEEWRFSTPTFLGNNALVRVVNYYVSDDGSYHVSKGDKVNTQLMVLHGSGDEEYLHVDWSERFRSMLEVPQGEPSFHHPEAYVWGLEDTRLVMDSHRGETIYTLSASAEYSRDAGTMNQVLGILDMPNKTLWIQGVIKGPQENRHDKNWVFAEGLDHVVYDWYPSIQIGSVNVDELELQLHTTIPSPESFRDMRGSTNGVLFNHEWWFVTHSVIYRPGQMRKYLHYLVVLNEDLTSILRHSLPFTFERGSDVEYCLGFKVEATALTFGYSVRDRSSRVMTVPWEDVGQLFI